MTLTIAWRSSFLKDHCAVLLYFYASTRVSCTIRLFTARCQSQRSWAIALNQWFILIDGGVTVRFGLINLLFWVRRWILLFNVDDISIELRQLTVPGPLPSGHGMARILIKPSVTVLVNLHFFATIFSRLLLLDLFLIRRRCDPLDEIDGARL